MPTECNPNLFEFARVEGRAAVASMYDSCIPFHLPVSRCPEKVRFRFLFLLQISSYHQWVVLDRQPGMARWSIVMST